MARRRMIDPHFWESADIIKIDVFARYIFMSMFSHADDDGRNIGSAVYIRNTTFPLEDIPLTKIKKALKVIRDNLSVVFYIENDVEYYQLTKWKDWQKVDHPSDSLFPEPNSESIANYSRINREPLRPNIIEDKLKEDKIKEYKEFIPPTIEEVQAYCEERDNKVNAKKFFDTYNVAGWKDTNGKPVHNWKQKMIAVWEKDETPKKEIAPDKPPVKPKHTNTV